MNHEGRGRFGGPCRTPSTCLLRSLAHHEDLHPCSSDLRLRRSRLYDNERGCYQDAPLLPPSLVTTVHSVNVLMTAPPAVIPSPPLHPVHFNRHQRHQRVKTCARQCTGNGGIQRSGNVAHLADLPSFLFNSVRPANTLLASCPLLLRLLLAARACHQMHLNAFASESEYTKAPNSHARKHARARLP
ncbi:hypothetical protein BD309DRAFT_952767 [Dichomitus squalens]|nr:hypothetical protein BD309DRAFT_952767 [Dichomitus squalens]